MADNTLHDLDISGLPKTTRVTFHNPERKQIPKAYNGDERLAREHYLAALFLKGPLGSVDIDRTVSLGKCAAGLLQLINSGDMNYLLHVCNDMLEEHADVEQGRVLVADPQTGDIIFPEDIE